MYTPREKEYRRLYYLEHRDECLAYEKKRYKKNRRQKLAYAARYRKANRVVRQKKRLYAERLRHFNMRLTALLFYSDGTLSCACCNEGGYEFLAIDHIAGGGNEHQRLHKYDHLSEWLVQNNLPDGYQILCHNCNMAKSIWGSCPHNWR